MLNDEEGKETPLSLLILNIIGIDAQVHSRITSLTAVSTDLDDFTRRREAVHSWAVELKNTINDLKQRKARLRPEAAQHDISQVNYF